MKFLLPLLMFSLFACGQEVLPNAPKSKSETITSSVPVKPFKLVYQMWNHADALGNGTMLYVITQDSLKVSNIGIWDKRNVLELAIATPERLAVYCSGIKISHLEEFYNNERVMITSGNEYYLKFSNDAYEKEVMMHMYYVKEILEIINELNKYLPENLKAEYQTTNELWKPK